MYTPRWSCWSRFARVAAAKIRRVNGSGALLISPHSIIVCPPRADPERVVLFWRQEENHQARKNETGYVPAGVCGVAVSALSTLSSAPLSTKNTHVFVSQINFVHLNGPGPTTSGIYHCARLTYLGDGRTFGISAGDSQEVPSRLLCRRTGAP